MNLSLTKLAGLSLAASFIAVSLPGSAVAAPVEYTAGHGDIGLAFEGGELELHYHFGNGAILDGVPIVNPVGEEFDPDEAYVRVSDSNEIALTVDAPFLGALTGDSVWVLPQTNTSGVPFLGIASEELDPAEVAGSSISLTGFSGPGNFALWQSSGVGGLTVFWQTEDGILPGGEILNTGVGAHDHFSYGFSAPGVYDLEFSASADLVGGGNATDTGTFRFVVGTAVPEPGTTTALAALMIPVLLRRRR